MTLSVDHSLIAITPQLQGLGGMVSFQSRLVAALSRRNIGVTFDLENTGIQAILVIGGTRNLGALGRARRRGVRIVQRLNGMNWLQRVMPPWSRQRRIPWRSFLRAESSNLLLAWIRRYLAHQIVYQSHFSQRWWERVYGNVSGSTRVVYNGVDLDLFTPGAGQTPDDRTRLLLVEGHLGGANDLGLRNAYDLAVELQRLRGAPVELLVAGDAPVELRAQFSNQPGVEVSWAGVVGRESIPELDRSAHILFSADLNAACPNSVIEALACGLPAVAFDTGALAELLAKGAGEVVPYGGDHWKLEPADIPVLARSAACMLDALPHYRQAARRKAETDFDIERTVDGYLDALLGETHTASAL